jgi:hypothetical protein
MTDGIWNWGPAYVRVPSVRRDWYHELDFAIGGLRETEGRA